MDDNDKEFLEQVIKNFNDRLSRYENDNYLSKQHLLDYVDNFISQLVEKFKLDIEG